jgi:molybdopterin synthase catalytic subunit
MIALTQSSIDVDQVRKSVEGPGLGGVVVFVGKVRGTTRGKSTSKLIYEAYEEMATGQMQQLAEYASERWGANVAIVHRVGELLPGEVAVVTAAACPHREEAFECCRYLIEQIKKDVPIWKQEFGPDGSRWVEGE